MVREVRCTNPSCGHPSRFVGDELGRRFRCVRCGTRLPVPGRDQDRRPPARAADLARPAPAPRPCEAPWERERAADRLLGVALPKRIGRFRDLCSPEVVRGAWVYRATDPETASEVSVIVPSMATRGSEGRQTGLERARALSRLRHPAIVPVLDAGTDGPTPYIACLRDDGPSLARVVAERGRLGPAEAAAAAADLAEALATVHAIGLVHGAVAPGRVKLGAGRPARLIDFHFESVAAWSEDPGVAPYTAPERLLPDAGPYLAVSDQYGLGALLYLMLSGSPPFEGPTERLLDDLRTDEPIPLHVWRPRLSRRLARICERAMARDPEARFASCDDLAGALRRWARRHQAASEAVGKVQGAARWVRRRPAAAVAATLAVLGLVATTTILASALIASTSIVPIPQLSPPQASTH